MYVLSINLWPWLMASLADNPTRHPPLAHRLSIRDGRRPYFHALWEYFGYVPPPSLPVSRRVASRRVLYLPWAREKSSRETKEAWPISLKIITELNESIPLPAPAPHSSPPSSKEPHTTNHKEEEAEQQQQRESETTTTRISVSTSKEWDPASEEAVRRIVRNILVEILGGGWVFVIARCLNLFTPPFYWLLRNW